MILLQNTTAKLATPPIIIDADQTVSLTHPNRLMLERSYQFLRPERARLVAAISKAQPKYWPFLRYIMSLSRLTL